MHSAVYCNFHITVDITYGLRIEMQVLITFGFKFINPSTLKMFWCIFGIVGTFQGVCFLGIGEIRRKNASTPKVSKKKSLKTKWTYWQLLNNKKNFLVSQRPWWSNSLVGINLWVKMQVSITFGLTICSVLKELDLHEIWNAQTTNGTCNIQVCCPLWKCKIWRYRVQVSDFVWREGYCK